MLQVIITECYGDWQQHTSRHKTTDRAVRKAYGAGKSFYRDHGISGPTTTYGQVGHYSTSGGCASMDTGRLAVTLA
jgi:hypothetical protein